LNAQVGDLAIQTDSRTVYPFSRGVGHAKHYKAGTWPIAETVDFSRGGV
jgi:hypothetical protein